MSHLSEDAAGFVVGFGAIIIYLAVFFPGALRFLPRSRWFYVGRVVSRVGAILIAFALILYGLLLGQVIPSYYKGVVFTCCATLVVAAGLYDLSQSGSE